MKSNECKAWLVDPIAGVIVQKTVSLDNDWDNLREIIGCNYLETVSLHSIPPTIAICDENGIYRENTRHFHYRYFAPITEQDDSYAFSFLKSREKRKKTPIYEMTFSGPILFFGLDMNDGELCDVQMNLKSLLTGIEILDEDFVYEPNVQFISLDEDNLH